MQIQEKNAAFRSEGFSKSKVSKNFACDLHGMNMEPLVAVGDRKQMSGITNSKINLYLDFIGAHGVCADNRRGHFY
jgi:hypothetical protein